jgi:hypothetical protein
MFILGHVGIGLRLGTLLPRVRDAPTRGWLLLGTLLPDLIDKPLYYGMKLLAGNDGPDGGLISCTRTVGHSALFALLVWLALRALGRRAEALALVVGMATHSVLDLGGDVTGYLTHVLGLTGKRAGWSSLKALLFPVVGGHFARMPFHSAREQLSSLGQAYTLLGEAVGAVLLFTGWYKGRAARHAEAPAATGNTP